LNPAVDKSIGLFRQLEEVFEPYLIMPKEFKEKKKQLPSQSFCKERKKHQGIISK
jgi:hypothetical protein